ncbi:MAG: RagB/SusD family nutrient uptake outer membrane protein [Ginsengibacter sp.]
MKNIKFIKTVFLSLVLFIGCKKSFLEKTPPDALAEGIYYKTADQAKAAVNAAYATLENPYLYTKYLTKLFIAPTGDVILSNTDGYNLMDFTFTAAEPALFFTYSKLYEGVFRSNIVLQKVPDITMDDALKTRYLAEAKFLRALYYWHLTTLYGEVPLFTQPFKTPDDALVAKSPIADIYKVMIQDLQEAIPDLPSKSQYGAADLGRATKGAAQALLGKIYLYDKQYQNSYDQFSEVVSSNEYGLVDDFNHIINVNFENNKESVFEVQYAEIGSSDVGNDRAINDNPQVNGGTGNTLPTQQIVDAFGSNDPRLGYSIFLPGQPFAPQLSTSSQNLDVYQSIWSATGYNIKKGLTPVAYINNRGTNWPIIRYADVLLMYAEAANEIGKIDEARDAVNEVRERPGVNMPDLTAGNTDTKDKMFQAIVHERRVELAFEFHRYNDLRRWGMAQDTLGHLGYTARDRYYPIPQVEIDLNKNLKQADGW